MEEVTISAPSPKRPARGPGRVSRLYLVLQGSAPAAASVRVDLDGVDEVVLGRGRRAAVTPLASRQLRVDCPDPLISATHAQLLRSKEGWTLKDAGSKNGTIVNGVQTPSVGLRDKDLIEVGGTFFLFEETAAGADERGIASAANSPQTTPGLATLMPSLAQLFADAAKVALSPVSVVISGETGTGKELMARAVHELSRRPGPLVAVNCGGLTDSLVLSELFGSRKGAFSGAVQDRLGLIRAADRGTLFLDEIGDLPPSCQAAFLRVLQEREVLPVGDTRPVPIDVRLVVATHRDMSALVAAGRFRGDLWARLSGHTIELPPLRDRLPDLGLLVRSLLDKLAPKRAGAVQLTVDASRALLRHDWPFNVRELENALGCALALAGESLLIEAAHLPESVGGGELAGCDSPVEWSEEDVRRREELVELLHAHQGNITQAARAMGKARVQLQRWIKRYRILPKAASLPHG